MSRTRDEVLAYSRGYNTGVAGRWPDHKPPVPPEPILRRLIEAARGLRDGFDNLCALLDEDDDCVKALAPSVDELDAALADVSDWLREPIASVTPPDAG